METAGWTRIANKAESSRSPGRLSSGRYRLTTGWRNGWKTKARSPNKNRELLQELQALKRSLEVRGLRVEIQRVRGYSGVELNEACDRLAQGTIAAGRKGRR